MSWGAVTRQRRRPQSPIFYTTALPSLRPPSCVSREGWALTAQKWILPWTLKRNLHWGALFLWIQRGCGQTHPCHPGSPWVPSEFTWLEINGRKAVCLSDGLEPDPRAGPRFWVQSLRPDGPHLLPLAHLSSAPRPLSPWVFPEGWAQHSSCFLSLCQWWSLWWERGQMVVGSTLTPRTNPPEDLCISPYEWSILKLRMRCGLQRCLGEMVSPWLTSPGMRVCWVT